MKVFFIQWIKAIRNRFLVDPRICQNCEYGDKQEPAEKYPGYVNPHFPKVFCLKKHKWMVWDARRLCFQGYNGADFKRPKRGTCLYCRAPISKRQDLCEECTWLDDMEEIADCRCTEDSTKRLLLLKVLREHPESRLSQALGLTGIRQDYARAIDELENAVDYYSDNIRLTRDDQERRDEEQKLASIERALDFLRRNHKNGVIA